MLNHCIMQVQILWNQSQAFSNNNFKKKIINSCAISRIYLYSNLWQNIVIIILHSLSMTCTLSLLVKVLLKQLLWFSNLMRFCSVEYASFYLHTTVWARCILVTGQERVSAWKYLNHQKYFTLKLLIVVLVSLSEICQLKSADIWDVLLPVNLDGVTGLAHSLILDIPALHVVPSSILWACSAVLPQVKFASLIIWSDIDVS